MRRNKMLKVLMLFTAAFVLFACSSNKKPPKESDESGDKLDIQIIVSPEVNPDIVGRPSPVLTHIFHKDPGEILSLC